MNTSYVILVAFILIIIITLVLVVVIIFFSNPNVSPQTTPSLPIRETILVTFKNDETSTDSQVTLTINHNTHTLNQGETFSDRLQTGDSILYTDMGIEGEYILSSGIDDIYFTDAGIKTNLSASTNVPISNESDSIIRLVQSTPQDQVQVSGMTVEPGETGKIPTLYRGMKLTMTDENKNKDITYIIDANPISSLEYNGDHLHVKQEANA